MATLPQATLAAVSTAAGRCLSFVSAGVAQLRQGRPLHPKGRTYAATVRRQGARTGVPWLDDTGSAAVLVRVSRAIGLPRQVRDIYGIAIRITLSHNGSHDGSHTSEGNTGQQVADLLFASTGDTRVGRFVLQPRPELAAGPLTTLLPVRTEAGPLLLRLTPRDSSAIVAGTGLPDLTLSYAVGTGPWNPLGSVEFGAEIAGHENDRHDPVEHQLPGQQQYPWVRMLREPAYRSARRRGRLAPHGRTRTTDVKNR